jgi:uncharacterized membrane protein YraQ (UPF0718 family)
MAFLTNLADLYLDAAPWLLLGLVAAGLLKAWIPQEALGRWLGGPGVWPLVKGALIGAPLPLCSCGVLPAAIGLRRGGASRGATVSFLIATPETGPDSVLVSYALLGPFMAVVRPLAAIFSAVATALMVAALPQPHAPVSIPMRVQERSQASCCDSGSCAVPGSLRARTLAGLRYAMTDILDDIVLWLGAGLVAAALIATWVPPLAMEQWGSGLPAMLLMLGVGIPMYICATASTPIAAGLLLAGISPGTVLVFLLAGPATNIATMAVVRRELGSRVLGLYLLGIALTSILLGLSVDLLAGMLGTDVQVQLAASDDWLPHWVAVGSGALLGLLAIRPLRRRLPGLGDERAGRAAETAR